jgi:hypothetical protein
VRTRCRGVDDGGPVDSIAMGGARTWPRRSAVLLGLAVACGDGQTDDSATDDGADTPAASSDTTDTESSATTGLGTSDGTSSSGGSTGTRDTVSTTAGSEDIGAAFIQDPDGGGVNIECDVWAQDCPVGEKCMPWANDGGSSWNATRCSPLDPNPAQVGDPCIVEGSGTSGIDNCDIAAMCWDVDPETNEGVCTAFCSGSEANPVCADPDTTCVIANEGTLILCLPSCDPLIQDCGEGQGCYPIDASFACAPDAGNEQGAYGDACEFVNVCDPGLFCASPDAVPNCVGAVGCCSEFCDLAAMQPDDQCSGANDGQLCTPWYGEDRAPPGYEDVGACAIPA